MSTNEMEMVCVTSAILTWPFAECRRVILSHNDTGTQCTAVGLCPLDKYLDPDLDRKRWIPLELDRWTFLEFGTWKSKLWTLETWTIRVWEPLQRLATHEQNAFRVAKPDAEALSSTLKSNDLDWRTP